MSKTSSKALAEVYLEGPLKLKELFCFINRLSASVALM